MTKKLFATVPGKPDGPSIGELYKRCPDQFRHPNNKWNKLAAQFRRNGGANGTAWKPRSKEPEVIIQQMTCFMAVAAWMLHEMLEELPTFSPLVKSG